MLLSSDMLGKGKRKPCYKNVLFLQLSESIMTIMLILSYLLCPNCQSAATQWKKQAKR